MKKLFKILCVIGALLIVTGAGASDLGYTNFFTTILIGAIGLLSLIIGLKGLKIMN
jgi:hypothetical protein